MWQLYCFDCHGVIFFMHGVIFSRSKQLFTEKNSKKIAYTTCLAPNSNKHLGAKESDISFSSWLKPKKELIASIGLISTGLHMWHINDHVATGYVHKQLFTNNFDILAQKVTICQCSTHNLLPLPPSGQNKFVFVKGFVLKSEWYRIISLFCLKINCLILKGLPIFTASIQNYHHLQNPREKTTINLYVKKNSKWQSPKHTIYMVLIEQSVW